MSDGRIRYVLEGWDADGNAVVTVLLPGDGAPMESAGGGALKRRLVTAALALALYAAAIVDALVIYVALKGWL